LDPAIKQRLVGGLVLVALAMIFMPALFNGGRPHEIETLKELPPMPQIPERVFEKPAEPENRDPVKPADEFYQLDPDKISTHTKNPELKPQLNTSGVPLAWVVQVGSYSDAEAAKDLTQKLQARGYKAFIRSVESKGKTVNRVLVGPNLKKQQAVTVKEEVDAILGINSLLLKFEP
jgi:DedD protein